MLKRKYNINQNNKLYNLKYYETQEFGYSCNDREDHNRIIQLLGIIENKRILEVGCGYGVLLSRLKSRYKIGIETNKKAIDESLKRHLKVIQGDIENKLPFKNSSFDIIILNEVIEHTRNPEEVFSKCFRLLKNDGIVVITTPIKTIFAHNLSDTHFSEMGFNQLEDILHKCNFKIEVHEVSGISFLYPILENVFYKPFRLLRYQIKSKSNNKTKLVLKSTPMIIDSFHKIADKTLLLALSRYRTSFCGIGLNQLVIARKNYKENLFHYSKKYYQTHDFVFKDENRRDHKRILQLLNIKSTDVVLEVGCGYGVLLKKILTTNKYGTETNMVAISECKKRGLFVTKSDANNKFPYPNQAFNIVIMNEVISHLDNPDFTLKECFRILKPDGKVILTTPVKSPFFHNISATHLHEFSIKDTKQLLEENMFKVIAHEACGISFFYPIMENIFFRPFRKLRYLFSSTNKTEKVKLIDTCHGFVDQTILKPLGLYRNFLLRVGTNQIILGQKIYKEYPIKP